LYYHKNTFTYVDSGRIQKTDPQLFVLKVVHVRIKWSVQMKCTGWYIIVNLETMRSDWFEIMCE